MQPETPVYERIVLKLSGEAMQERGGRDNISTTVVHKIAERIKEVRDLDVQVSVVIGGGNIWRGLSASQRGMDRTTADYMGMLATVINALALRSGLDQIGAKRRRLTGSMIAIRTSIQTRDASTGSPSVKRSRNACRLWTRLHSACAWTTKFRSLFST